MSSPSSQLTVASCSSQPMDDLTRYMPLHKYILEDDLESVKREYDSDDHALEARITANLDTALHVAVGTGRANRIVEYLLNKMSKDQVALQNRDGNTVLSIAAVVGNIQAAKLLVKKDENLNRVANNCGWIPLIEAAQHQKKEMTEYLLQFTEGLFESEENGSTDTIRVLFMNFLIGAKFYGLALELVNLHPSLTTMVSSDGESLLKAIARKPSAFPSKIRKLDIWERCFTYIYYMGKQKAASMHNTPLKLVHCLCKGITRLDHERASSLLKEPLLLAAELGIIEVVELILKTFPDAISFSNEMNYNAFQLAIMNRHDNIFNLIFQMSTAHRNSLVMSKDICGNNILHLAGKLAPQDKLNLVPGAVMQMQREIQWFKVKLLTQTLLLSKTKILNFYTSLLQGF
ncbi:hypothetical protein Pint_12015 [Pistacia integerrima]|uniref:Uncharacterized protein n=1 Tax=Pistacia integerrima TaxID=434235 RepID=A0ACC0XGB3_9ROSI|nr:hypothetical protein Pint_12015 [Pistacia integerrima]